MVILVSFFDGQETFASSCFTLRTYCVMETRGALGNASFCLSSFATGMTDFVEALGGMAISCEDVLKVAGAEGIEPTAFGFGDRRSTS